MTDVDQLSRRLSDLLEPSDAIDGEIAVLHARHLEGVPLGEGRPAYTTSLDAALAFADAAVPGWLIDHLGDDGSGHPGFMKRGGATCEMTNGRSEVQGQAFNRATAVLAAVVGAIARNGTSGAAAA